MKTEPESETPARSAVEHYQHHGARVAVISEVKGQHRRHCLCYQGCQWFKPGQPDNCEVAQSAYHLCRKHGLVTPVYECPLYSPPLGSFVEGGFVAGSYRWPTDRAAAFIGTDSVVPASAGNGSGIKDLEAGKVQLPPAGLRITEVPAPFTPSQEKAIEQIVRRVVSQNKNAVLT